MLGYSSFQVMGMMKWGQKSKSKKKSLGLPTEPKKIPGPKIKPQKIPFKISICNVMPQIFLPKKSFDHPRHLKSLVPPIGFGSQHLSSVDALVGKKGCHPHG